MQPIAVLFFILAGAMFLFALMVYKGETGLIRTFKFTSVKDKTEYARHLGKSIALVGVAILIGAALCLVMKTGIAMLIMLILVIAALVFISKNSHKYY